MRVYVQWTNANPGDWFSVDITKMSDLRNWPRKAEPQGGETIDDTPGWVHTIMVQGVSIQSFDHYSVSFPTPADGSLSILAWNDDPVDWPAGPWGIIWTFHPPQSDPAVGGRMNTLQYLDVYGTTPFYPDNGSIITTGGPATFHDWVDFPEPSAAYVLHGIWTEDALNEAHLAMQQQHPHGWREWVE